jgi:hypothetical protein
VTPHRLVRELFEAMTIHGVGELYARNCLGTVTPGDVVDVLSALTRSSSWVDCVAADSYRHANGFYKIPLFTSHGARLRLHFWDGATSAEENVHNHRWNLASRVLLGTLEDEIYDFCSAEDSAALLLNEFEYRKAGPDEAVVLRRDGRAVRLTAKTIRMPGAAYSLNPRQLHRIVTRPGAPTMTLMAQSAAVFSFNTMFTRDDVGDPDVERGSLGPDVLLRVVSQMVSLLNQTSADRASVRRD